MSIALVSIIVLVVGVIFVNGWTDAPNAIATAVSTRSITPKGGVMVAAVFNLLGVLVMTWISPKVAETISKLCNFDSIGGSGRSLVVLAAAMFAIVLWAVLAWFFGIPTSESHALIAGLTGSALALGGLDAINMSEWGKVFIGLGISSVLGFTFGYGINRGLEKTCRNLNRPKANRFFRRGERVMAGVMAFLHGAQDGQKFIGVFLLGLFLNGRVNKTADGFFVIPFWLMLLCALVMSLGTSIGGYRIIKSVGMDMVKLEVHQGFSSDLAAASCLLLSTLFGIPLSTTHTKTTSMVGVACSRRASAVDWRVVMEMISAWVITFPFCGLIGYLMAKLFLLIF
ncbi:MAG: inorganic phosphate transporter [Eubacteriales bacterium]